MGLGELNRAAGLPGARGGEGKALSRKRGWRRAGFPSQRHRGEQGGALCLSVPREGVRGHLLPPALVHGPVAAPQALTRARKAKPPSLTREWPVSEVKCLQSRGEGPGRQS